MRSDGSDASGYLTADQRQEARETLRAYLKTAYADPGGPLVLLAYKKELVSLPASAMTDGERQAVRPGPGSHSDPTYAGAMVELYGEPRRQVVVQRVHTVRKGDVDACLQRLPAHLFWALTWSVIQRHGDEYAARRWQVTRQTANGYVRQALDALCKLLYGADRWGDTDG